MLFEQAARVLTADSCCCCCCCGGGPKVLFARVADWMDERLAFDQAVVWDKGGLGMGWKYRRNYEFVMVGHRKGSKLRWFDTSRRVANVVRINRVIPRASDHPTPKPVALVEHFLRLHSTTGDTVLDPFMGAGTTLVAARNLGRRAIGIEIEERYCEVAARRLEAAAELAA